ncbi:hypothetical protein JW721_00770 [Candidatus Micrarchaeota archaeon]|nr:hypothetical protein [Candidatus Micrarchaeota archaeon]
MPEIDKKKEQKFLAHVGDEFALEILEQDAQKIRQVTPGFHMAPRVLPMGPNEHRLGEDGPILHLPLKLNKKEHGEHKE